MVMESPEYILLGNVMDMESTELILHVMDMEHPEHLSLGQKI